MRHVKGLNIQISDRKRGSRTEDRPRSICGYALPPERFSGQPVAIDRDFEFAAEHVEAGDVISVLMCEQNGIEAIRGDTKRFQSQANLSRTETDVDQYPAILRCDKSAVSGTATSENRELEHSVLHIAEPQACQARVSQKRNILCVGVPAMSICSGYGSLEPGTTWWREAPERPNSERRGSQKTVRSGRSRWWFLV